MSQPALLARQPRVWLMALMAFGLIALNVLDAFATLYWIQLGAEEANPFMAYIVQYDSSLFIGIKTLGITAAAAFLIYFAWRRYAYAYYGMMFLLVVYAIPTLVHIFMWTHTYLR